MNSSVKPPPFTTSGFHFHGGLGLFFPTPAEGPVPSRHERCLLFLGNALSALKESVGDFNGRLQIWLPILSWVIRPYQVALPNHAWVDFRTCLLRGFLAVVLRPPLSAQSSFLAPRFTKVERPIGEVRPTLALDVGVTSPRALGDELADAGGSFLSRTGGSRKAFLDFLVQPGDAPLPLIVRFQPAQTIPNYFFCGAVGPALDLTRNEASMTRCEDDVHTALELPLGRLVVNRLRDEFAATCGR